MPHTYFLQPDGKRRRAELLDADDPGNPSEQASVTSSEENNGFYAEWEDKSVFDWDAMSTIQASIDSELSASHDALDRPQYQKRQRVDTFVEASNRTRAWVTWHTKHKGDPHTHEADRYSARRIKLEERRRRVKEGLPLHERSAEEGDDVIDAEEDEDNDNGERERDGDE